MLSCPQENDIAGKVLPGVFRTRESAIMVPEIIPADELALKRVDDPVDSVPEGVRYVIATSDIAFVGPFLDQHVGEGFTVYKLSQ